MRTIKFRAWDKEREFMYEPLDLEEIYCDAFFYKLGRICLDEDNFPNLITMQYTGLKDKNGQEIYEGDILTIWIDNHKQKPKYIVEDMRELYHELERDDSYYRIQKCEVIGNIYENPELLEESPC